MGRHELAVCHHLISPAQQRCLGVCLGGARSEAGALIYMREDAWCFLLFLLLVVVCLFRIFDVYGRVVSAAYYHTSMQCNDKSGLA